MSLCAIAAVVVALPAAPANGATPATSRGTAVVADVLDQLSLAPEVLPSGSTTLPEEVQAADIAAETVTLRTVQVLLPRLLPLMPRTALYSSMATSKAPLIDAAAESARLVNFANGVALEVTSGDLHEYRWRLTEDHAMTVGTIGVVQDQVLRDAIASLPSELQPSAASVPASEPRGVQQGPVNLAAVNLALPGQPAGADTNMNGTGPYTDDWGNDVPNKTVCYGCAVTTGNVVGVWQAIMYADRLGQYQTIDGGLSSTWYTWTQCNVDGVFGEKTAGATARWQYDHNFVPPANDGKVGPVTWGSVDNRVAYSAGLVVFRGEAHTLLFQRNTVSGTQYDYSWRWFSSDYRYTGYPTVYIVKQTPNNTTCAT